MKACSRRLVSKQSWELEYTFGIWRFGWLCTLRGGHRLSYRRRFVFGRDTRKNLGFMRLCFLTIACLVLKTSLS
jgi:hypothetical protein